MIDQNRLLAMRDQDRLLAMLRQLLAVRAEVSDAWRMEDFRGHLDSAIAELKRILGNRLVADLLNQDLADNPQANREKRQSNE